MKHYLISATHPQLTRQHISKPKTPQPTNKNCNPYERNTKLAPNIAENVLEEKANNTKKSEIYYDRNAKDLNELKPGDVIRVKPEGLVKGQEG